MPPLRLVNRKAFRLHGAAKQIAVPPLERSATGIIGKRAWGHFVVGSWHFDRFASCQVVECEIDGAAAIVAGGLGGGRGGKFFFRGGRLPQKFCGVPVRVSGGGQQAVAER